jgi:hypothetical protein
MGSIYRDCEVDRPAKLKKDVKATFDFPRMLRCAIVEMEFAVDSSGLVVDSTARVLSSSNPEFAQLTRRTLSRWRYEPATKGGVAVQQVVRVRVARPDGRMRVAIDRDPAADLSPQEPCA